MQTEKLKTFMDIDFSIYKFPIIVVYEKPFDFPRHYVARLFNTDIPTAYTLIENSYGEIKSKIPSKFIKLQPNQFDDPTIIAIYI